MTERKKCTTASAHVHCFRCGSCHCSWWRVGDFIIVSCICGEARYRVRGQATIFDSEVTP